MADNFSGHIRISEVNTLKYLVAQGSLFILNPTKATVEDNYFCQGTEVLILLINLCRSLNRFTKSILNNDILHHDMGFYI